jgi:hypothetical protein
MVLMTLSQDEIQRFKCDQSECGTLICVEEALAWHLGACVAKWLAHLPFTSKVACSNLNEDFSMWLEPSPNVKGVSQRSAESREFYLGTPCFLQQGKLTGWVRHLRSGLRSLMKYGLKAAAAKAPFVSSMSTSVCFTSVRFYLSYS